MTEEQLRQQLANFAADANNPAFSSRLERDELGPAITVYDDEGVLINWLRTTPPTNLSRPSAVSPHPRQPSGRRPRQVVSDLTAFFLLAITSQQGQPPSPYSLLSTL